MLGREATVIRHRAGLLRHADGPADRAGLAGTVEFFPEEGKYHLDGHRKCGIRVDPEQTRELDAICPDAANR